MIFISHRRQRFSFILSVQYYLVTTYQKNTKKVSLFETMNKFIHLNIIKQNDKGKLFYKQLQCVQVRTKLKPLILVFVPKGSLLK